MLKQEIVTRLLPDVAVHAQPDLGGALDWVGMADIQMPVRFDAGDGVAQRSSARVDAFVNLKRPDQRGIHMSRLYLRVEQALAETTLDVASLEHLLREFIDSQAALSDGARLRIRFDQLVRRPALRSAHSGWRAYPVEIGARLDEAGFAAELAVRVQYSSTCPASAALARQLIQDRFAADFASRETIARDEVLAWLGSEQGIVATPHSQRSTADVRVKLAHGFDLPIIDVIDLIEHALKTPVQTAVKREDEQAFALANGQNLMFCEDAARRMQRALDVDERIADFRVQATHHESLHPHDAVAVATKGVAGGYRAA